MERPSRSEKLSELVIQARVIIELARPTTAYILKILDALGPADIEELGKWDLDKPKTEAIIDRITLNLDQPREIVRVALGRVLQQDVWGNRDHEFQSLEEFYRKSGKKNSEIDRYLGCPPKVYPFYLGIVQLWHPTEARYDGMIIEDNTQAMICEGYLVAKGLAFPTSLAMLEATVRQNWSNWQALWKWF